jgi:hypothetical protein
MQLSSTMKTKKPPGDSPPGDESPNDDDGAPPEDIWVTLQCLKRNVWRVWKHSLVMTERKKREKAERKLATEQIANRELRSDLKVLKS